MLALSDLKTEMVKPWGRLAESQDLALALKALAS